VSDLHSPEPALLDAGQLAVFADFGLEDFKDILNDMVADVPAMLDQLEAALAADDENGGKRTSHTLRGMLLNFGCSGLAAKLFEIEHHWPPAGTASAAIMSDLRDCWKETLVALDKWLADTYQ
jgi:HPt (histidine-containing phosphotransfer) domain-containing protein